MRLFWKIFTAVFITLVAAIFFLAYFTTVKQITNAEQHLVEKYTTTGDLVSREMEHYQVESRWPFDRLNRLSKQEGFLFWWVVREDGVIHLADQAALMGTYARDYFPQAASRVSQDKVVLNWRENYGLFITPLEIGKKKWTFWLGFSLTQILDIKKNIILLSLLVSMAAALGVGTILYIVIGHMVKPIGDLTLAAASVGKGDLSHRVAIKSRDEIGLLANAFNQMAADLEMTTVTRDYMDSIMETMSGALIVVSPDARIITTNMSACRLLGYARRELIGAPMAKVLGRDQSLGPKLEKLFEADDLTNWELSYQTKDGCQVPVLLSSRVRRDAAGQISYIVCIAVDITQYKRAEEALRASESFLANIFDSILDGIIIIDTNFTILRTNPFMERRFPRALPLVGKKCYTAYHRRDKPCKECAAIRTMETGQADLKFETIRKKSGEIAEWVEIRSFPLLDPATGKVGGVIEYIRDISQQKQAEEALRLSEANLRQSQKMEAVGRLAGGVAHDFNNILTAIIGYSELLQGKFELVDPRRDDLEEIRRAAERASSLTRQLLAFSRKQIFAPKVINLNNLILNLDKMLRRLLSEDIKLNTIPVENLGEVMADPGQIEQVILNLAVNARDAMPRGGVITIETQNVFLDAAYAQKYVEVQPGDYVMLAVSDTGSGLDEASRARIFEPFFTTKKLGQGTGLGLSTVHGIIKQSGGHITVYSEVGQGATFKVYLPRLHQPVQAEAVAPACYTLDRGTETILLVEDEDMVRQVARRILEMHGYTVLEAASGPDALLVSQKAPGSIHLMLTDVVMPGMSGGETAERLQAQRPELKVLFMSGHTENSIVHHGVLDPGVAFIQKPFRSERLVHQVRQMLDQPLRADGLVKLQRAAPPGFGI